MARVAKKQKDTTLLTHTLESIKTLSSLLKDLRKNIRLLAKKSK